MRTARVSLLVALLFALSSCSIDRKQKRLSDTEFDHYYALRVFMKEDQKKSYLKMKTEDERNAYLKEIGLWDRFYKYEDYIREKIVGGDVQEGWTKDMLYMSWGAPWDRRNLAGRHAERSELLVYRFEQQPDGSVLVYEKGSKTAYRAVRFFAKEVVLDDDRIAGITEVNATW